MSKEQDHPAVMYGPPEMFFEEKYLVEEELRRIFVVAAIFVNDNDDLDDDPDLNPDLNDDPDLNDNPDPNDTAIANSQQPTPTANSQQPIANAIANSQTQILACERGYGKWQGWWEFPGGKIEPGETDEEALRREIREEMETEIEILRYYDTIDYRYDDFLMTMHLYLCKPCSPTFVLNNHSQVRWLSHPDLTSVRWLPADIELITRWSRSGFDF